MSYSIKFGGSQTCGFGGDSLGSRQGLFWKSGRPFFTYG